MLSGRRDGCGAIRRSHRTSTSLAHLDRGHVGRVRRHHRSFRFIRQDAKRSDRDRRYSFPVHLLWILRYRLDNSMLLLHYRDFTL